MDAQKQLNRPNWDDIWMSMARIISKRSVDPAFKTGAIIVTADNLDIIAMGYNGLERGGSNVVDSLERGKSGTVHAEINALIKPRDKFKQQLIMYVTLSPCCVCARAIINAGINVVIYDERYRDSTGINILTDNGIDVRKYTPSNNV